MNLPSAWPIRLRSKAVCTPTARAVFLLVWITHASAETMLIDDFNDLIADGWTAVDSTVGQTRGPATIDVNGKREYRFEGGGPVAFSIPAINLGFPSERISMSTAILAFHQQKTHYQLECGWPMPTENVREDVVNFWLTEGALPNRPAAEQRAHELLVVARDQHGSVAGVSTAVPAFIPQLGFPCFYYRTFVGRDARTRGLRSTRLFWNIMWESYRLLNERFLAGYDPDVLGCYAVIENPSIMRRQNKLVWQDGSMNAVYIGRTQDGRHIRVWYFEGAQVP